VRGRQSWLGPARAGQVVRVWADCDDIHVLAAGTRIKSVRPHLSINDLTCLLEQGAQPVGPPPAATSRTR